MEEQEKLEKPIKKSIQREIMEWIICIVVAFAFALFIKHFIFTPTLVMQDSMTPTILDGERVLINRLVRTFKMDLHRGDIITFEAPVPMMLPEGELKATYYDVDGLMESFFYYVVEAGKTSYIKRVIGLPGDKIKFSKGDVYVNDTLYEEPYLSDTVKTERNHIAEEFVVPEGYIFAMGDNRSGSTDCRMFGCIPIEKVEGRVTMRIWPLNKFGGVD